MDSKRLKKVASLLQEEMSNVLLKEGTFIYGSKCMVTVTNVVVTPDLSVARFYFSIFNTNEPAGVLKLLQANNHKLRGLLGNKVRFQLRKIPALEFYQDDTLDYVFKMEKIFDQIKKDREALEGPSEDSKEE